jgi:hypothetical protein
VRKALSWRRALLACSLLIPCLLVGARSARAEQVLVKNGDVEVYTDGRAGGFVSYVNADGLPRSTPTRTLRTDGFALRGDEENRVNPDGTYPQGKIEGWRIRSGFVGNVLGFGARTKAGDHTFTAYLQLWAWIESELHRKGEPNFIDARQGYAKVEGFWGSVLAGRTRCLFSRGATDINAAYAHRFGVGFPGNIDSRGPSLGMIGFGVLGSGFCPGVVYATPVLAGFQLSVGAFDPLQLAGTWTRTKLLRPEAELTFELPFGKLGKVGAFVNGTTQQVYKRDAHGSTNARGFGAGARLELGPARLGGAMHYGKGLGMRYALEPGDATVGPRDKLRMFDGYYGQAMVVLDPIPIDVFAGAGISRAHKRPEDGLPIADGVPPDPDSPPESVPKSEMGINAGVVWHIKPWLHFDIDGFRADFRWYGVSTETRPGDRQVAYILNSGMTVTW